uniref:4-hydroxybenzoate transporter n=1 Tax=Globodera pallida TaxID=36090 RepID=A0A183BWB0_GLOPA
MKENENEKRTDAANGQPLFFADGDWIGARELSFRRALCFAFRLCVATFLSAQLWDFLFSPIWMHGYLWALNQHAVSEQGSMGADKSAISILDQQLAQGWSADWPEPFRRVNVCCRASTNVFTEWWRCFLWDFA